MKGFLFRVLDRVVFIEGGPYRNRPTKCVQVSLAEECSDPYDIRVPIEDFGVPDNKELLEGLLEFCKYVIGGNTHFYIGCKGGLGRTGLFMSCLAKLVGHPYPVEFIRNNYCSGAVETREQEDFVEKLPLRYLKFRIALYKLITRHTIKGRRYAEYQFLETRTGVPSHKTLGC